MSQRRLSTTDFALIAVFTGLIAAFTLVPAIPVGTVGVPITLQTLAVALAGMILGPWRGTASVLLYLVLGFAGLPIFAGATGGPGTFAKPSIGYLLAFPLAALVIGLVSRVLLRRYSRGRWGLLFVSGLLGSILVVHPLGIVGMSVILKKSLGEALIADMMFWPGDLIKNAIAASVALGVLRAFPSLLGERTPARPVEERVAAS